MAETPQAEVSLAVPGAPAANKGISPMLQQLMTNPGNFMQLLGLFFLAFTNPDALKNGGLENGLADLLGFENANAMNNWRQGANGNFLQALGSANWGAIDQNQVQREYHKYAALADSGNPLLELIGQHESSGDYNRAYGPGTVRPEIGGKPLTECTLAEVRQWQREYVAGGSPSSAVGKYQIIQKTMDGLINELAAEDGMSREQFMASNLFDEKMQDRMAVKLLERRGLDNYLSGNMSEQQFMRSLSQEWASLPKDGTGRSYYAGDGLNAAGARPAEVLGAMRASRDAGQSGDGLRQTFARAEASEQPLEPPAQPEPRAGLPGEFQMAALGQTPAPPVPATPPPAAPVIERTIGAAPSPMGA